MAPWFATQQRTMLLDNARVFAPTSLRSVEYVFIRHDAHRVPLQPPYDGLFRVLEVGDKAYIVDIGGKLEHVSVDHLKPAHLEPDLPVGLAQPPRWGCPPNLPHAPTRPLRLLRRKTQPPLQWYGAGLGG